MPMSKKPVPIPTIARKSTTPKRNARVPAAMPPRRRTRGKSGRAGRRTRPRTGPPPASPAAQRVRRRAAQGQAAPRSPPSRAGWPGGTQPTSPRRARRPRSPRRGLSPYSEVQIPLDEIVLLQPAQPFADLTRSHRADPRDRLEISLGRTDDRVQVSQFADDLLDDAVGEPRDPRQNPEASGDDAVVERIDLARESEQLGETLGLEQLPVRQGMQSLERELGARTRPIGVVVADNERAFRRNLADELVELHPDQACFSPKLDAVTFDLSRHARRHLGPLKD